MESTLSLGKSDYEAKVGKFAGYGLPADWASDAEKAGNVKDSVESGLRRFYHCGYNWSFLKPWVTLPLASGASTIALPDDFGGFEGRVAVSDSSNGVFRPLEFINPGRIEQMYSEQSTMTGRPAWCSLRPLKAAGDAQRNELYLFPVSDQAYTLRAQYYILPDRLNGTGDRAYGGAEHVETILESCLAIFEERYDDRTGGTHAIAFEKRLQASIQMDARKKPQVIGRNADTSDDNIIWLPTMAPVTINGVDYSA